jgi:hypothetical protein
MNREKRDRFIRLAVKRVNRAIRDIRLIANLSNRSTYEFSDEDARKIVKTLQKEIETLKARFGGPNDSGDNEFKL